MLGAQRASEQTTAAVGGEGCRKRLERAIILHMSKIALCRIYMQAGWNKVR